MCRRCRSDRRCLRPARRRRHRDCHLPNPSRHRRCGTVEFPPDALVVVEPERDEPDVLADARLAGVAFAAVVIDTSDTLHPVDARWALIDDRIVELGTATAESSTSSSRTDSAPDSRSANSADELPAPGSFSCDSAAFVDMLADIDGVESATFVMPGVAAVALSGSRDVLDVDGVGAVVDDVLLGHSDEPMQDLQWSLTNTGATSQAGGWPGVARADADVPAAWTVSTGQGVVADRCDDPCCGAMPPITIRPPVTGSPPTSGAAPTTPGGSGQPPTVTQPPSAPTTMPTLSDPNPPSPPPTTSVPSAAPPTTVPVPGGPGSPPVTTTPPPAPDIDGAYSVTAMTPRAATTAGNTRVSLTGVFPTMVPVHVWFGTAGIAEGRSTDGATVVVDTPAGPR